MAVPLEFISLIVPISVIDRIHPGGWAKFSEGMQFFEGGCVQHDEYLFRDGAMNPLDMKLMLDDWVAHGLKPTMRRGGQKVWKDCCVVPSLFSGPSLPCDWLEISEDGCFAWMKGKR